MSGSNQNCPGGGSATNAFAVCEKWVDDGTGDNIYGYFSLEESSIFAGYVYVPLGEVQGGTPCRRGDRVILDLSWDQGPYGQWQASSLASGTHLRRRERNPSWWMPTSSPPAMSLWVPSLRRTVSVKPHVFAAGTAIATALRPTHLHLHLPLHGLDTDVDAFSRHYELWATPAPPLLARPVPHLRDVRSLLAFLGKDYYLLDKSVFFDMDRCRDVLTLGNYPMAQFFVDKDPQSYCWQLKEGDSMAHLLARYEQWPDGRPLSASANDTDRDTRFYVYRGVDHFSRIQDKVPDQLATSLFPLREPFFSRARSPEDLTIRILRRPP